MRPAQPRQGTAPPAARAHGCGQRATASSQGAAPLRVSPAVSSALAQGLGPKYAMKGCAARGSLPHVPTRRAFPLRQQLS